MKAICYLQVKPDLSPWTGKAVAVQVSALTQTPPKVLRDSCIAVRLVLDVPAELFEAAEVEVLVNAATPVEKAEGKAEEVIPHG